MSAISTAVGLERRSRVAGYKIKKGFFDLVTPNLPQVIAVLGEVNTANQGSVSYDRREITSAQQAGEIYGYGSPIHQIMRILRPISSEGVGGIPTVVFPQESDGSAFPTEIELTITGTATSNATHSLIINGRADVDFETYAFSVVQGDTPTEIASKMVDSVNSVLSSPVTATAIAGVVTLVSKWVGITSAEINVDFDVRGNSAGVTYAETKKNDGAGSVSLANFFEQLGNEWVTAVINPYAKSDSSTLSALEQFNGFPDPENPTGRYTGIVFKPFMAFFGETENLVQDLADITDAQARINQVTNVLCPAPNSKGFTYEAAANVVRLFARTMQDTPHLTINNQRYPDMPTPIDGIISGMADYNNRDFLVKKGCSTVTFENGSYVVQDLVTTYHPAGEVPLQYAYARNLNLDWNVRDGYSILENQNVKDHTILKDSQISNASKTVKPKQWQAVLYEYFEALGERALLRDPDFSKESLKVEVNSTNPDRFDTFFRYRRTGVARIQSTDVEAGF